MSEYKICILAAGVGSRLNSLIGYTHKGLVPIKNKPSINWIVDNFDPNIELVIAVGHQKELFKEYLELAYPDRKITYIEIDKFVGKDTGPGYSLLKCKEELQCPFLLTTCDTITLDKINLSQPHCNWIGIHKKDNPEIYCTIDFNDVHRVTEIFEKSKDGTKYAYIGTMFIKDYEEFWKGLIENQNNEKAGEIQVSNGWKYLDLYIQSFETWYDVGNMDGLNETRKALGQNWNLEKEDEALYFVGDKVIKYFKNPNTIKGRLNRAEIIKDYIPKILNSSEHFYSYEWEKGELLSIWVNNATFRELLHWCDKTIWEPVSVDKNEFSDNCNNFYKKKTYDRVGKWFNQKLVYDIPQCINGYKTPTIEYILSKIDWDLLSNGVPVKWHGDLHMDNILLVKNGFKLLDWRQDFDGRYDCGDIYYDLAKLYHNLIVSHSIIFSNNYSVTENKNVDINIHIPYKNNLCIPILETFVKNKGLSWNKVEILTYLIFLNICCLHHDPYNKFLYYLSKLGLTRLLEGI